MSVYTITWNQFSVYTAGQTVNYNGYNWIVNSGQSSTEGTPPSSGAVWTQILSSNTNYGSTITTFLSSNTPFTNTLKTLNWNLNPISFSTINGVCKVNGILNFSTSNHFDVNTPPTYTISIYGGTTGDTLLSSYNCSAPVAPWTSTKLGYFNTPIVSASTSIGNQILSVKLQCIESSDPIFATCLSTSYIVITYNS